ncbi:hypothetical protein [Pseudomonas nitroreducens]|uniref:hypothetical protein n=1 Tax=Pseudomonas nitroreducens TaxID=46680 RepID=UPI0020A152D9|nr:hypothetical protein [Pseudomonas nitroreducens]MCP1624773.1 outer membrane lipoprotein SlyB [Pseudomonas nitroreducens]
MREVIALCSLLLCASALADEIVSEVPDNTVGGGFGAGSGVLLGGALGGPIGALVGAGIGALGGAEAQEATGSSGHAYVVRDAQGHEHTVRSPNARFEVGQQVSVSGDRLKPL